MQPDIIFYKIIELLVVGVIFIIVYNTINFLRYKKKGFEFLLYSSNKKTFYLGKMIVDYKKYRLPHG